MIARRLVGGSAATDMEPTRRSTGTVSDAAAVRGFGVAADLDRGLVGLLAAAAESAGYRSFWVNDMPDGDGLSQLRVAAGATFAIELGVGVLPLDRWSPKRIAERVEALGLPVERLTLGIGAGSASGGLARTEVALRDLRSVVPGRLIVGALGPRMRRLAAEEADGILLDWMTPAAAHAAADDIELVAATSGRHTRPATMAYVFASLGPRDAVVHRETGEYYASLPTYAAHFARMEAVPADASVSGQTPRDIREGLRAFDVALDEVIVRPIVAHEHLAGYLDLLAAAAPQPPPRATASGV